MPNWRAPWTACTTSTLIAGRKHHIEVRTTVRKQALRAMLLSKNHAPCLPAWSIGSTNMWGRSYTAYNQLACMKTALLSFPVIMVHIVKVVLILTFLTALRD